MADLPQWTPRRTSGMSMGLQHASEDMNRFPGWERVSWTFTSTVSHCLSCQTRMWKKAIQPFFVTTVMTGGLIDEITVYLGHFGPWSHLTHVWHLCGRGGVKDTWNGLVLDKHQVPPAGDKFIPTQQN